MADNFTSNFGVRELTLGASFTNNKASQYHTIKYDFKPASVDVNKMATVDVGSNNQVTVTVPHLASKYFRRAAASEAQKANNLRSPTRLPSVASMATSSQEIISLREAHVQLWTTSGHGAGVPQTVFKGSQRPYTKECVLIIDKITGEMTLEKLSSNIQVKKTRQESSLKPRPLTPVTADFTNTTQRSTSRTRVATNRRANPNPGAAGSGQNQARFNGNASKPAQNMVRSPPRVKTSPPQAPWSGGGNSTLASLPMIGLDDVAPAAPPQLNGFRDRQERAERPERPERQERPERIDRQPDRPERPDRQLYPERPQQDVRNHMNAHVPAPVAPVAPSQDDSSSSSSSDSDSNSGSDSDSDDDSAAHPALPNGAANPALPRDVLNDDLCLSESGSDSD